MAIETKTPGEAGTKRAVPTDRAKSEGSARGEQTPKKKRPVRRRATTIKKAKNDQSEGPTEVPATAPSNPTQVDVAAVAASRRVEERPAVTTSSAKLSGEAGIKRDVPVGRVRVRGADPPAPSPQNREGAKGPGGDAATIAETKSEKVPARPAKDADDRRQGRRPRRNRGAKKAEATGEAGTHRAAPATPTSPAEALDSAPAHASSSTADASPTRRSPIGPSTEFEERSDEPFFGRGEMEPESLREDEPAPGEADLDRNSPVAASPPIAGGSRPVLAEKPLESQRRRRGRRGRRGGQKGDATNTRTAPTEDRVAESTPTSRASAAVAVIEPDSDSDEIDDLDAEVLGSDLEILPFVDRKGKDKVAGRELIINVSAGFECRVAILHEGRLEELFMERESTQSHVGNIYKGRVTNVEPSIQAAFVDFGLEKNGFLHISDVQPQYFPNHSGGAEDVGRKIPRHHRPPIQKCFRRGQEVIVQITKEGVGTKGPTLTSYLSIPGRYLVMMPGMSHSGVSRKIEDEEARRRMRDVLSQLTLPKGIGFILRTAGLDRPKRELQRDLNYLQRLWKTVVERIKSERTPAELYRESDLVIRTLRDVYTTDFSRIVVDDAATAKKVREFVRIAMPRTKVPIELYSEREPLFHRLGIEAEIERINNRHVPLASGGSLVIDSTEAMVAIDVNSGRFRTLDDAEETALRINVEAAEEIARQLRLRDLGGLIVCDFIDMRLDRNKRKVELALRDALKKHKERARTLRMSAFGLIEMTRQRQGPSIRRNMYHDCPHCRGSGQVKQPDSVMLDALRMLQLAAHHKDVARITLSLAADVAFSILNRKRDVVHQIELETGKRIVITGKLEFTSDQMVVLCEDARGREVAITGAAGN